VTPTEAPAQPQEHPQPPADLAEAPPQSGFGSRGRARRRARFLRKARELAYRDLGGLVFNLHRFGQRNDALVLAKLTTVGQIDAELRILEAALGEREAVTVLREAGVNACPRCAAIHSSEDRFCPNCGLSMDRHADLPIAGAPATPAPSTPASPIPAAANTTATPAAASAPAAPATATPAPAASPSPVPATAAPAQEPSPPPPTPTEAPTASQRQSTPTEPPPVAGSTSVAAQPSTEGEQPTEILHPQPPES
jgi:hypothetical protein